MELLQALIPISIASVGAIGAIAIAVNKTSAVDGLVKSVTQLELLIKDLDGCKTKIQRLENRMIQQETESRGVCAAFKELKDELKEIKNELDDSQKENRQDLQEIKENLAQMIGKLSVLSDKDE